MADAKAGLILTAIDATAAAFASADARVQKWSAEAEKATRRVGIAAAAAAAALTLVTRASLANIDAMAKQADALQINITHLAGLRHAAELANISQDQLDTALERQRKTLYDASQGLTTATRAIEQLGLSTADLLRLDTREQFLTIADALSKVENHTLKAGIAQTIFGRTGQELIPLLNEGRDAIAASADEAERLGIAVSRVDAAMVEQANDAMTRVKASIVGLGNVIAIQIAPIIEGLSTSFVQATADAETMGQKVRTAIDVIAVGVGLVGDAFHGWRLIFAEIGLGIEELRSQIVNIVTDTTTSGLAEMAAAVTGNNVQFQITKTIATAAAEEIERARDAAQAHLDTLIASVPPSVRIQEAIAQWRQDSLQAAQNTAAAAAAIIAQPPAGVTLVDPDQEATDRAAEQARERLATELEQVRVGLLTREQVEIEAINRRQAIIAAAFEQELITHERAAQLSAEISRRGQEELTRISEAGWTDRQKFVAMSTKQQAAHVIGSLAEMTAGVAQHSKAMFKVNQLAAIANAVVNTAQGVTKALSAYPPPLSFAMAAAQAAAGAVQISAIKSATFGGGTTPSLAGSTGVVGGQPVQQLPTIQQPSERRGEIRVEFHGTQLYGPGGVAEFEELMVDVLGRAANDRDVVIIAQGSRQASVIRGD